MQLITRKLNRVHPNSQTFLSFKKRRDLAPVVDLYSHRWKIKYSEVGDGPQISLIAR